MAGTILISDQSIIDLSTKDFDYFSERIRADFPADKQDLAEDLFSPIDEGGMAFISLIDASEEIFSAFCTAVFAAEKRAKVEQKFPLYSSQWDRLLNALQDDSRFPRGL